MSNQKTYSGNRVTGRRRGDGWVAAAFLSPTLLVFSAFVIFPVLFSFYLSFHKWNMFGTDTAYVGLENYGRILDSRCCIFPEQEDHRQEGAADCFLCSGDHVISRGGGHLAVGL